MHLDYIINEGRRSDGLFYITDGAVEVLRYQRGPSGQIKLDADRLQLKEWIATLCKGDIFGETSLLEPKLAFRATASVRALHVCETLCLSKQSYLEICQESPQLRFAVEDVAREKGWRPLQPEDAKFDCARPTDAQSGLVSPTAFCYAAPECRGTSPISHPRRALVVAGFIAHNWGNDQLSRDNHARAAKLNHQLQSAGFLAGFRLRTWFDVDQMQKGEDIKQAMARGIDASSCVLVLITRQYMDMINSDEDSNAKYEFTYFSNRKASK